MFKAPGESQWHRLNARLYIDISSRARRCLARGTKFFKKMSPLRSTPLDPLPAKLSGEEMWKWRNLIDFIQDTPPLLSASVETGLSIDVVDTLTLCKLYLRKPTFFLVYVLDTLTLCKLYLPAYVR